MRSNNGNTYKKRAYYSYMGSKLFFYIAIQDELQLAVLLLEEEDAAYALIDALF